MPDPLYKDPSKNIDERTDDLLARMTIKEKIAQLTSMWIHQNPEGEPVAPGLIIDHGEDVWARLLANGIGQITRPFGSRPIDPVKGAEMVNELQKRLIEETRLGIPALCHEECLTGFMAQGATSFPSPLNYGSTWEPGLIEQVGNVIRRQMRSVGSHQGLAPVADVSRDARWGRVEETVGEDPYLVGTMVCHYVKGLQGRDLKQGVLATLKHFAGYSFSEGGRNFAPAHVGRREFMDIFLLPFEMAVKEGGAASVMNAYQDIDGEPPAASRWLLTEVLRDKWGFDGIVVSDYAAVSHLHQLHRVAEGRADAAALALKAGLDVELPNPVEYLEGLPEALDQGLIAQSDIDLSVSRVLKMKFRLGLFENPYVDPLAIELNLPEEDALARTIAEKSITLLKNDGTLPLPKSIKKLAVIGPNAHERMALFGDYSFENHVIALVSPDMAEELVSAPTVLDELRNRLPETEISYTKGCEIMSDETSGIEEAVDMARGAEAAILVVGDKAGLFRRGTVGEGTDATDLSLPGGQTQLVEAVLDTGRPVILVLLNGRPFSIPQIAERASGILEAWFPGQAGASVIADAILGDLNPGGKTTLTFSQSVGTQPAFYNRKFLAGGVPRLPDLEPVFPFGHGLSYTEFKYSDLDLSASEIPVDGQVDISCTIRNIGDREGDEVVQLYLQDLHASVTRPILELKGFTRVDLKPGEAKRVTFTLHADLLSFTGLDYKKIVEPGRVAVRIGSSSRDIRLKREFELTGPVREVGEDRILSSQVRIETAD